MNSASTSVTVKQTDAVGKGRQTAQDLEVGKIYKIKLFKINLKPTFE